MTDSPSRWIPQELYSIPQVTSKPNQRRTYLPVKSHDAHQSCIIGFQCRLTENIDPANLNSRNAWDSQDADKHLTNNSEVLLYTVVFLPASHILSPIRVSHPSLAAPLVELLVPEIAFHVCRCLTSQLCADPTPPTGLAAHKAVHIQSTCCSSANVPK